MSAAVEPIFDLSAAEEAEGVQDLDAQALRQKVREYQTNRALSQAAIAQLVGRPESTFSAWLKGDYKGDNARVEEQVRIWLRSTEAFSIRRKSSLKGIKFAATVSAQKFIAALEHAQALPDIAVISAGAGVGKTATVEHYQRSRPNVWLFTCDPSLSSYQKMLEYMRDTLGITRMPSHRLSRAIADRLSNTQGLVIIDEAQHLKVSAIDMIRSIHDRGKVGLAFLGNNEVWKKIEGGGRDSTLAQLFSRVGIRVTVTRPSDKDIAIILDTLGIQDAGQRKILAAVAKEPGALRALDKVLGSRTCWPKAPARICTRRIWNGPGAGSPGARSAERRHDRRSGGAAFCSHTAGRRAGQDAYLQCGR